MEEKFTRSPSQSTPPSDARERNFTPSSAADRAAVARDIAAEIAERFPGLESAVADALRARTGR